MGLLLIIGYAKTTVYCPYKNEIEASTLAMDTLKHLNSFISKSLDINSFKATTAGTVAVGNDVQWTVIISWKDDNSEFASMSFSEELCLLGMTYDADQ